jgi:hypothetical protein
VWKEASAPHCVVGMRMAGWGDDGWMPLGRGDTWAEAFAVVDAGIGRNREAAP